MDHLFWLKKDLNYDSGLRFKSIFFLGTKIVSFIQIHTGEYYQELQELLYHGVGNSTTGTTM